MSETDRSIANDDITLAYPAIERVMGLMRSRLHIPPRTPSIEILKSNFDEVRTTGADCSKTDITAIRKVDFSEMENGEVSINLSVSEVALNLHLTAVRMKILSPLHGDNHI